jgi:hypothetical protein
VLRGARRPLFSCCSFDRVPGRGWLHYMATVDNGTQGESRGGQDLSHSRVGIQVPAAGEAHGSRVRRLDASGARRGGARGAPSRATRPGRQVPVQLLRLAAVGEPPGAGGERRDLAASCDETDRLRRPAQDRPGCQGRAAGPVVRVLVSRSVTVVPALQPVAMRIPRWASKNCFSSPISHSAVFSCPSPRAYSPLSWFTCST